jgi:hypothetical protein
VIASAVGAVKSIVEHGPAAAMNRVNARTAARGKEDAGPR